MFSGKNYVQKLGNACTVMNMYTFVIKKSLEM